jgi:hypothetical protein
VQAGAQLSRQQNIMSTLIVSARRAMRWMARSARAPRFVRVLVYPGEVQRVAAGVTCVHVLAGVAYLTQHGRDVVLRSGDRGALGSSDPALLSPLTTDPLVVVMHLGVESTPTTEIR